MNKPDKEAIKNVYDDGNIPHADLPQGKNAWKMSMDDSSKSKNNISKSGKNCSKYNVEPLPESSRPRKDGPGGD